MSLLQTAQFLDTVVRLEHLPRDDLPEIAFVGRSNSGKSSAINRLCDRKRLAYASKTPGRTQALNLFSVRLPGAEGHRDESGRLIPMWVGRLVDTPGYGYAEAPLHTKAQWDGLAGRYLQSRKNLRAVVLISDIRRGLTKLDEDLLYWIANDIPVLVLLTKADKLGHQDRLRALKNMRAAMQLDLREAGPSQTVQSTNSSADCLLFSATQSIGLDETREMLTRWLVPASEKDALV